MREKITCWIDHCRKTSQPRKARELFLLLDFYDGNLGKSYYKRMQTRALGFLETFTSEKEFVEEMKEKVIHATI